MDIHIERPTLSAPTPEENIAAIDTWIADTSDKLNIALKTKTETVAAGTAAAETKTSSGAFDSRYASSSMAIYLGSGRTEATKIV